MSFLEQFLKESSTTSNNNQQQQRRSVDNSGQAAAAQAAAAAAAVAQRRGLSVESDDGDVEDNRAPSIGSSRSNMSADMNSPGQEMMSPQVKYLTSPKLAVVESFLKKIPRL